MKNNLIKVIVVVCALFLNGCSSDEVIEQVANIAQEVDPNVLAVKGGTNYYYEGITYEEAFENFFASPSWRYFTGEKEGADNDGDGVADYVESDVEVVEFTGYCMYQDVEVEALIQFTLDMENGTFEATYLSFNDVPQSQLMLEELIDEVFTEALNDIPQNSKSEQIQQELEEEVTQQETEEQTSLVQEETTKEYPPIESEEYGDSVRQELIDAYCGDWSDQYSQRCHMTIESENGIDFRIEVYWGNSASSTSHWVYSGFYNSDMAGIEAVGSYYDEYISDSGEEQVTELYAEGSALFYLSDGYMYWLDFQEFVGNDCYFARTMYY